MFWRRDNHEPSLPRVGPVSVAEAARWLMIHGLDSPAGRLDCLPESGTALEASAVPTAQAGVGSVGVASTGMTWQVAKKTAENHCGRNPFPGVNALAKIVKCSPSTMSKAINHSKKLRAKLAEHEARRTSVSAVALTEGAAASARQAREPDPGDAVSTAECFQRLMEQAKPSERVNLNAMTPAQRRELVATIEYDPDAGRRMRGRSR